MKSWRFVGRARELAQLENEYKAESSNLILIYGRRRVGKSELILHFKKDRPGIYFVGKQAPASLQIQEFLGIASKSLNEPLLAKARITDWHTALSETVKAWKGPAKLILALDEFQWMVEQDKSLPSVIQELWDREWQHTGKIMLILAGSYVGFMERDVLGSQKPLGGRRTSRILLEPFQFWEAADFHPNYSREDQARAYFITGGVPLYLLSFKDTLSIEQNIRHTMLNEFSPLSHEPEFLLREELQGLEKFQAVLDALSCGRQSLTDIAKALEIDPRSILYQLQTLTALGYVERVFPLASHQVMSRRVRYGLGDAFLRFWYRFIFPSQSLIRENPEAALKDHIAGELDAYFGHCFERICRDALRRLYALEAGATSFQVGEFWIEKKLQIDVVGLRQDHWIDLGECKWGHVSSVPSLVAELESRVRAYPNPENATLGRMIFTRKSIKAPKEAAGIRFFSLEDLYRLGQPH